MKIYKVKSQEDIFTISNTTLNNLDNVINILSQNNLNLNSDLEQIATENIIIDETLATSTSSILNLQSFINSSLIKTKSYSNQSIYDLCLQTTGSLDYIINMLIYNNIENLDNDNLNLQSIIFDYNNIKNYDTYKILKTRNIMYATLQTEISSSKYSYLKLSDGYVLLFDGGKIIIN